MGFIAIILGIIPPTCFVFGMAWSGGPIDPTSNNIVAVLGAGVKAGPLFGPTAIILSLLAIHKDQPVIAGFGIVFGLVALVFGASPFIT